MSRPFKKNKKYKIPIPRKGRCIDWDGIAKSRNFFNGSAQEMFNKLFPKMTITEMATYLGVHQTTLSPELKRRGFIPTQKKADSLVIRKKYSFPYLLMGFKTEREMWIYFIEKKYTAKKIAIKFEEISGKCFLYTTIENYLRRERKKYIQEKKKGVEYA